MLFQRATYVSSYLKKSWKQSEENLRNGKQAKKIRKLVQAHFKSRKHSEENLRNGKQDKKSAN
jgi:hypothetical protein